MKGLKYDSWKREYTNKEKYLGENQGVTTVFGDALIRHMLERSCIWLGDTL